MLFAYWQVVYVQYFFNCSETDLDNKLLVIPWLLSEVISCPMCAIYTETFWTLISFVRIANPEALIGSAYYCIFMKIIYFKQ